MTWIITSICLYLIGMIPVYAHFQDGGGNPTIGKAEIIFIVVLWPIAFVVTAIVIAGENVFNYFFHPKVKS